MKPYAACGIACQAARIVAQRLVRRLCECKQPVKLTRQPGEGVGPFPKLVIRGAMLIDGSGAPPRGPVDIVVEGNRIAAINGAAPGLPLKSVAEHLDISTETAKTYLGRVREKYAQAGREARTKIALHRRAVEDGLLSAEESQPTGA